MAIVITKNMKCKWYQLTIFLFNMYITSVMSRSSFFTGRLNDNGHELYEIR